MTDAQLENLWQATQTSIAMVGKMLNSAALWEVFGAFMGLLIIVSLITALITRASAMFGFRARD